MSQLRRLGSGSNLQRAPKVDFINPTGRNRWLVIALWGLALVIGAQTAQKWQHWQDVELRTLEVEQRFTDVAVQQEQLMQTALRASPDQKKQLEAFRQQGVTPFPLLDLLEHAWSAEVAVQRLDVSTVAQSMSLELESKTLNDTFRFIERLKADKSTAVFLQQSTRNSSDPMLPMGVKLSVQRRGDTP